MLTEERKIKQREYSKRWREKHPEKHKEQSQKWRDKNHQKDLANKAKYRVENKEKIAEAYRKHILQKRFGLSKEEYDSMLETQNSVCAICRKPCSTGRSLAVDHNHETGIIRSLLCRNCNVSIGLMKEDPELLRAAANYLELHKSKGNSNE